MVVSVSDVGDAVEEADRFGEVLDDPLLADRLAIQCQAPAGELRGLLAQAGGLALCGALPIRLAGANGGELDAARLAAALAQAARLPPGSGLKRGEAADDRRVAVQNDDLLAGLGTLDQRGELRLRLRDLHRRPAGDRPFRGAHQVVLQELSLDRVRVKQGPIMVNSADHLTFDNLTDLRKRRACSFTPFRPSKRTHSSRLWENPQIR